MKNISNVKPLKTRILFQFIEDLDNSKFNNRTKSGIFVVENKENQVNQHRWGKVISVGDDVSEDDVKAGEYILIEALGWTNGMDLELEEEEDKEKSTYWFTDLEKVMCVSETQPDFE